MMLLGKEEILIRLGGRSLDRLINTDLITVMSPLNALAVFTVSR